MHFLLHKNLYDDKFQPGRLCILFYWVESLGSSGVHTLAIKILPCRNEPGRLFSSDSHDNECNNSACCSWLLPSSSCVVFESDEGSNEKWDFIRIFLTGGGQQC
ncbi:hypothetical protein DERF_006976 [Dermatophagoides farinae]|uniref:Uncharacterized protein n=1 Tax=Dermatophagoides farinae TaxID=6954 RepID=A0A922L7I1_DERFA|nr:hypothetical protein DERF_006976 [Dermatophagoides farinae]